ncbi:Phosphatidylinositol transfer protein (PITP) [Lecanora helva]
MASDGQLINGDAIDATANSKEQIFAGAASKTPNEQTPLSDSNNPLKTPFIQPAASSTPRPAPVLTSEQETKYASLLKTTRSWTDIPTTSASNSPKSPLTDTERMWLTRECLLRYLRATKWNLAHASTRLEATLVWRREYGVYDHTADYISEENASGKQMILGYDNECRPCLYQIPSRQNTKKSERQIHHLVFMLEAAIDLTPPGTETLALLIDFKDARKGDNASPGQGRQVISILQNHYPERLGRACMKDLPWIIWGFFKIINPFIDPLTREKMVFDTDLRKLVPPEQLLRAWGGECEFVYEHEVYWPRLNGMVEERRRGMRERWERAGKRVGESEGYLKGVGEAVVDEGE